MLQFSITEALDAIARDRTGPCVSLVLPLEHSTKRETENVIDLKNLVRDAEEILQAQGCDSGQVSKLLRPLHREMEKPAPWQGGARGYAVFLSPDSFQTYSLPVRPMRVCRVDDQFMLSPLLQLHRADGRFAVLALNLKKVRLYEATRYSFSPVPLNGVPAALEEYLRPLEFERNLGAYTSGTGAGKAPGTVAHGQYPGEEQNKKYVIEFFEQLDSVVRARFSDSSTPLVLAGVEYLVGCYRKQSSYPSIHGQYVPGSPERVDEYELHRRAWELVAPRITRELDSALERFERELGRNHSSVDVRDIVIAAARGHVDTLFVDPSRPIWGTFERADEDVQISDFADEDAVAAQKNGNIDLIDLAVRETWRHRGEVYFIDAETYPNYAPVSAVLRAAAVTIAQ